MAMTTHEAVGVGPLLRHPVHESIVMGLPKKSLLCEDVVAHTYQEMQEQQPQKQATH